MGLKIEVTGLDNTIKKVNKKIQTPRQKFVSKAVISELAKESADDVRIRTRLGYGVTKRGAVAKLLKPLSSSYVDFRAGKVVFYRDAEGRLRKFAPKKKPKLSTLTTANTSNLTFSGKMLDSLYGKYLRKGTFVLTFKGKNKRGGLKNSELADINSKDRPFLELTNKEVKKLKNRMVVIYKRLLRLQK